MNDWFTIGQFSKRIGVSVKALRIYEKMGLLTSHTRGDNGYRYYQKSQIEVAYRLKDFKDLGFTLQQIKALLSVDVSLDSQKLAGALSKRLEMIAEQEKDLAKKKNQIERILTSLKQKTEPLEAAERKYIMAIYEKISIVITGVEGLEQTAQKVQEHLSQVKMQTPVILWDGQSPLPEMTPVILVIHEKHLASTAVKALNPNAIVVKNMSAYNDSMAENYLNLFQFVGPHTTTIINADDESSVLLAGQKTVQKGRIYYFSKNMNLEKQIRNIGGIVSDGKDLTIYGFSQERRLQMKLNKTLSLDEEVSLMSSLAAVMDAGLPVEKFNFVR